MFEIGRVCMKIAGRDAGKKCLVIDVVDEHFVMIDGQTRRRKCNIKHLEPINQAVQINKNAPAPEVARVLNEIGILVEEKKQKVKSEKKAKTARPKRARKKKELPVKEKVKEKTKIIKSETKTKKLDKNKPEEKVEEKA